MVRSNVGLSLGIKTGSRVAVSLRENRTQAKRFRQILRLHRKVPQAR